MGHELKIDQAHTPGPWRCDGEDFTATVVSPAGWTIAKSDHIHTANLDDAEEMHVANMRLIAASPDLLDAVQAFLRAPSIGSNGPVTIIVVQASNLDAARAAIAKATQGA